MTVLIRIIAPPPSGFVPADVREAWVGVEMPAEPDNGEGEWSSDLNAGGYVVKGEDAVKALLDAGKDHAAACWSTPCTPRLLLFVASSCEEVRA